VLEVRYEDIEIRSSVGRDVRGLDMTMLGAGSHGIIL
jgi:hypothetical protein